MHGDLEARDPAGSLFPNPNAAHLRWMQAYPASVAFDDSYTGGAAMRETFRVPRVRDAGGCFTRFRARSWPKCRFARGSGLVGAVKRNDGRSVAGVGA